MVIVKEPTASNRADMLTKPMSAAVLAKHCESSGQHFVDGRSRLAKGVLHALDIVDVSGSGELESALSSWPVREPERQVPVTDTMCHWILGDSQWQPKGPVATLRYLSQWHRIVDMQMPIPTEAVGIGAISSAL